MPNRFPLNEMRLKPDPFQGLPEKLSRGFFLLFLAQALLVSLRCWQPRPWFPEAQWPEGVLLLLGTATVITTLSRSLPVQNLAGSCAIIGVISALFHYVGALSSIPFGPYTYTRNAGQTLIDPLPGSIPLLWVLIVLCSRGAARSVLRYWRSKPNYGYRLLIATLALILWMDLSLEPFACTIKGYWLWSVTKLPLAWYGAPLVNFLGWLLAGGLIVAFSTPFLLSKSPAPVPGEHISVGVWCVLQLLMANAFVARRLWPAAVAAIAGAILVGSSAFWSWWNTRRATRPSPRKE